jgi:hypothetical protein
LLSPIVSLPIDNNDALNFNVKYLVVNYISLNLIKFEKKEKKETNQKQKTNKNTTTTTNER